MSQPAAGQAPNPLEQLRDIHLPESVNAWELAPGWWVLIGLLVILLAYLVYRWLKTRHAMRLLKPATQELQNIANMVPDNQAIAQLSALLKRVSLIYYPKKEIAALSGAQWVDFLNRQSEQVIFNDDHKKVFSEIAYQPRKKLEASLWQQLVNQSEIALVTIIRNGARKSA